MAVSPSAKCQAASAKCHAARELLPARPPLCGATVTDASAELVKDLIASNEERLRRLIFTALRDADATEDVLAETWLRAWRHLSSGGPALRSPSAWLSRVALTRRLTCVAELEAVRVGRQGRSRRLAFVTT